MARGPEQRVFPDSAGLARSLAEAIQAFSLEKRDRSFTIALSGGSTPKLLYELLAQDPFREAVCWEALEFFFGDERSVGPEHADSNFRMAREALLDHVPVLAHRMDAEGGKAGDYENLIQSRVAPGAEGVPAFDLILLGMGDDGHTASLFPGTESLEETTALVVMNEVPQLSTRRMTLTYPLINGAHRVWAVIAGAGKAAMVRRCLGAWEDPKAVRAYPILGGGGLR